MKRKARVLIVDDQRSIRAMLHAMIAQLGGEVVGEAQDGEEAVTKCLELQPDIVLMDINMPKMDGVEALKRINASNPEVLVIMLTSQNTAEVVRECIMHGAKNFLLKSNPAAVLYEELRTSWAEHSRTLERVEHAV
jgi:two-component system chemotaxis response regulator CheY